MIPLDFEALYDAVEHPRAGSRDILFAGLASARAAWRVRAAEGLLKLAGKEQRGHRALTHQFGSNVDAIFTPAMDELRTLINLPRSDAWSTFGASLVMNYDSWHDGVGYNLESLSQMPPLEQNLVRQWLHSRLEDRQRDVDLRDLEAAAALGETKLLESLARHPNHDVRLRAKDLLKNPADIASELCRTFSRSRSEDDVLRALDLVPSNGTPEVRDALISRVKKVDGTFINSAMVLLEVFGGVNDSWGERPFLFRVQAEGPRGPLMQELLARITKE
jgi:hypothetical protein